MNRHLDTMSICERDDQGCCRPAWGRRSVHATRLIVQVRCPPLLAPL